MNEKRAVLDRSERHTNTGIGILRIASGIFFLVSGIFKILMPEDFLAMMSDFPAYLQPHLA